MILQFGAFEGLVALGMIFVVFGLGLALVLGIAYMDHRKEMRLIEEGAYAEAAEDSRAWILAVGLLLVAIGLGNAIESYLGGAGIEGITAFLVGLAALAYYAIKRRQGRSGTVGEGGDDETSA
ncbi:hypothetical protein SAMN05216388_1003116 [Halorientalis persicus]|uniref:Uncharacterized protein n=1 Tax=Halorientalis persicus TaxID=1367881 RepID=A0A1H8GKL9_9EURY|nr:hypothetical protein [Halorientalis persicus]SEN44027.1 hypothetical protein SAMN05216388_1003116 [Halorientalis persicus]